MGPQDTVFGITEFQVEVEAWGAVTCWGVGQMEEARVAFWVLRGIGGRHRCLLDGEELPKRSSGSRLERGPGSPFGSW